MHKTIGEFRSKKSVEENLLSFPCCSMERTLREAFPGHWVFVLSSRQKQLRYVSPLGQGPRLEEGRGETTAFPTDHCCHSTGCDHHCLGVYSPLPAVQADGQAGNDDCHITLTPVTGDASSWASLLSLKLPQPL